MEFKAFSLKDKQTFIAFLGYAESNGLSDIVVLRQRLQEDIAANNLSMRNEFKPLRKQLKQRTPEVLKLNLPRCECGANTKLVDVNGLKVITCAAKNKCGWSNTITEEQVNQYIVREK